MDTMCVWQMEVREESVFMLFPRRDIVYLSPNASSVLSEVTPDKVYVIGGLIDENIRHVSAVAAELVLLGNCSVQAARPVCALLERVGSQVITIFEHFKCEI